MFRYNILRHLPQWFIGIFAVLYTTGYLVDFFYYSSHSIADSGADLLKLKYIQNGINFMALFSIVTTPVFFLLFGKSRMLPTSDNPNDLPPITTTTFMTSIIFFFVIYYTIIFTPVDYFYSDDHPYRLGSLFLLLFLILAAFVLFLRWLPLRRARILQTQAGKTKELIRKEEVKYYNIFSGSLLFFLLVSFFAIFCELIPTMKDILYPYGGFFFLFCVIFTLIAYRMYVRLEANSQYLDTFGRIGYISIFSVGLLVVYYLTVGVYAYTIFPKIPNVKGGANYESSPTASIYLQQRASEKSLDPEIPSLDLRRAVVIYSTSSSLYVANACDWQRDRRKATIFQINRDGIRNINLDLGQPIKALRC
jgi:hypothetical protein